MQALNLSTDSFDQDNTFTIEIDRRRGPLTITAKLFQDYQKEGDGIYWAMQRSACLKSHYTAKDDEERAPECQHPGAQRRHRADRWQAIQGPRVGRLQQLRHFRPGGLT